MALEDRVKQLEDELKVLKNEIQTTLLDIQEQVLSHYYPSLYPSLNTEISRPKAANNTPPREQQHQSQEQQYQTASPVSNIHSKYKTKTVTLVEEFEEDDDEYGQESDEPIEPPRQEAAPVSVPKRAAKSSPNNGNGRSTKPPEETKQPQSPDSSNKNIAFLDSKLVEENSKFLDSLFEAKVDEDEDQAVSFDEFSELLLKGGKNPERTSEPLTGEMLDDLFNETFPFLEENSRDEAQSVANPLNSQAVKLTVRKLLSWVEESMALIGNTPTKRAVEMYIRAGDLPSEMHDTLIAIVDSNPQHTPSEPANIRTIINMLSKLNDILDHHTPEYLTAVMRFITEVNFG